MAWKAKVSETNLPAKVVDQADGSEAKSSQITELLRKIDSQLQEGQPKNALALISRGKVESPWVTNAAGVCLLRLGEAKQATQSFRSLVMSSGGWTIREDVPTVFKTNLATALLACNDIEGCRGVLSEVNDPQNPVVQQLLAAIQHWKKSLSLWEKVKWYTGDQPNRPVVLDFVLGDPE